MKWVAVAIVVAGGLIAAALVYGPTASKSGGATGEVGLTGTILQEFGSYTTPPGPRLTRAACDQLVGLDVTIRGGGAVAETATDFAAVVDADTCQTEFSMTVPRAPLYRLSLGSPPLIGCELPSNRPLSYTWTQLTEKGFHLELEARLQPDCFFFSD